MRPAMELEVPSDMEAGLVRIGLGRSRSSFLNHRDTQEEMIDIARIIRLY